MLDLKRNEELQLLFEMRRTQTEEGSVEAESESDCEEVDDSFVRFRRDKRGGAYISTFCRSLVITYLSKSGVGAEKLVQHAR